MTGWVVLAETRGFELQSRVSVRPSAGCTVPGRPASTHLRQGYRGIQDIREPLYVTVFHSCMTQSVDNPLSHSHRRHTPHDTCQNLELSDSAIWCMKCLVLALYTEQKRTRNRELNKNLSKQPPVGNQKQRDSNLKFKFSKGGSLHQFARIFHHLQMPSDIGTCYFFVTLKMPHNTNASAQSVQARQASNRFTHDAFS